MRTESCGFSGHKIYPSRGILFIRNDGKSYRFVNQRAKRYFSNGKSPRKFRWTVFFRQFRKKGALETVTKRRTRKVVRPLKAIIGASLEVIKIRRAQNPEERMEATKEQAMTREKLRKDSRDRRKQEKIMRIASQQTRPVKPSKVMAHSR
jgi:large subunit ribosomal protein L24e